MLEEVSVNKDERGNKFKYFYSIWGKFIEFILGKGKASKQQSMQFWKGGL